MTSTPVLCRLWLHQACRGLEYEAVSARQLAKSIGCSKMFQGKDRLDTKEKVRQAGQKGKGETGKGGIHRLRQDVPRRRQAGHKGKGETGWTQRKR